MDLGLIWESVISTAFELTRESVMEYISYDLEVSYKFMKLRKVICAEVLMLFRWWKTDFGIDPAWKVIEYSFYNASRVIIRSSIWVLWIGIAKLWVLNWLVDIIWV